MGKQTEIQRDIERVQKSIQASWDKIIALSYLHPELKDDQDYLEINSAAIYLADVAGQLARKHRNGIER